MIKHHPSDETLFRFANGSLEPGPRIIVAVHVGGCAICASRISEFEAVGGSLMYNIEPDDMEPSALDHVMAKIEIDEAGRDRLAVRPRLPRADLGIHLPQVLDDCGIGPWRWIGPGVRWSRVTLPDDDHANVMLLKVTAGRKLREVLIAFWLEAWLSKDEILSLYLALAPYGGNLEGIRAASLAYFGKEPKRLTVAEAALLVALPQAPEARRPDRDANAARAARDRVLGRMVAASLIDDETAAAAGTERIGTARRTFPMLAAHLGDVARRAEPSKGVLELTIDARLQAKLEQLAADRAAKVGPKASVAILVADHVTGDIVA